MSSLIWSGRLVGATIPMAASLLALPVHAQSQAAPQPITQDEAVSRALAVPDWRAAGEGRRDAARAEADGVRRFDNPSLEVRRGSVSGPGEDETEWEAEVVQSLDLTGRRASLRRAAEAEADAVDLEVRRADQERVAAVRRAWVECAVASRKADLSRRFSARLAAVERIVSERTDAGDVAIYDLRRMRVEARTAEAEAAILEAEVGAACAGLSALTDTTGARAAGPLLAPMPAEAVVADRPDLRAGERRAEAARQQVRAADRSRLPELEFGLGWKRLETMGIEADGPQFSVGLTLPLFDNGSARARQARAEERAAAAELALDRRTVDGEIAAAAARVDGLLAALTAAIETHDDAQRLGAAAQTAYEAGEGDVTELVDAYRAAHAADLFITELTGRANLAVIELDLARGGQP
ncbi:TolC family protein [Brevundimonas sp. A19_0]|uniref:TolC family protein n=1 Tax=Brevundimonas sp. A19_0 TaxID=2821087 RepID=UPI001ADB4FA1|nr:TolC family protein [Brevundimonas sp. A19_0]MBO9500969.1 TolC family protein [Brevundimonas sp. A19_0]